MRIGPLEGLDVAFEGQHLGSVIHAKEWCASAGQEAAVKRSRQLRPAQTSFVIDSLLPVYFGQTGTPLWNLMGTNVELPSLSTPSFIAALFTNAFGDVVFLQPLPQIARGFPSSGQQLVRRDFQIVGQGLSVSNKWMRSTICMSPLLGTPTASLTARYTSGNSAINNPRPEFAPPSVLEWRRKLGSGSSGCGRPSRCICGAGDCLALAEQRHPARRDQQLQMHCG